ncbi:HAD-IA family hydrolase [Salinisphaera sp. Q1T1-3]|uniref:HAD-IA family hydrolase n=1 Tax=Salinisphaera sp. Q1T1-3 TaxID=2321229 RepID=UPI000E73E046|nr:HAD-IA family hydrolase [Salinisphaera sp. Q1T1-3]RJS91952.1 HAD family hydrolase [Salinisphaera sp. Q1T1-3]
MTPPIAAIIYDCDGTLVDSEGLNARSFTDLIAADHGLALDPIAVEAEFRGRRFAEMCDTLATRHGLQFDPDFVPRYRTHTAQLFEQSLQPIPGVAAAIEALGTPRCVASSGPPDKMAVALRVTGLAGYFGRHVYSAYDIDAWKPAPDLFWHAAAALGVAPAACAVIEDSDAGVEAGRRAGMPVFGFNRAGGIGAHPDADLTLFTDYADLPGLIAARR